MGDFISGIGHGISSIVAKSLASIGHVLENLVHTANQVVPGGFPVVVVLVVIALLVGWASLRR